MGGRLAVACLVLFLVAASVSADSVLGALSHEGETILLRFRVSDGSTVALLEGGSEDYLVLRTGTPDSTLFQFPLDPDDESWDLFRYSFYFRGGGPWNEGLDLNSLTFADGEITYTVFEDYHLADGSMQAGLRIEYPDGTTTELQAVEGSLEGSLLPFRTSYPVRRDY